MQNLENRTYNSDLINLKYANCNREFNNENDEINSKINVYRSQIMGMKSKFDAFIYNNIDNSIENNINNNTDNPHISYKEVFDPKNEFHTLQQLESDRKVLVMRNIELEKEINKLKKLADKSISKSNDDTNNNSSILKANSSYMLKKNRTNNKTKLIKNTKIKLPNKRSTSVNKTRNANAHSRKSSINTSSIITNNSKVANTSNINSKSSVNYLRLDYRQRDKKIKYLKENIENLYKDLPLNIKDRIREIKCWRERCHEIAKEHYFLLNGLRDKLNEDKKFYKNILIKSKSNLQSRVKEIMEKYNKILSENEKKIDLLKRENERLLTKESKIKEVFMFNFNN